MLRRGVAASPDHVFDLLTRFENRALGIRRKLYAPACAYLGMRGDTTR